MSKSPLFICGEVKEDEFNARISVKKLVFKDLLKLHSQYKFQREEGTTLFQRTWKDELESQKVIRTEFNAIKYRGPIISFCIVFQNSFDVYLVESVELITLSNVEPYINFKPNHNNYNEYLYYLKLGIVIKVLSEYYDENPSMREVIDGIFDSEKVYEIALDDYKQID